MLRMCLIVLFVLLGLTARAEAFLWLWGRGAVGAVGAGEAAIAGAARGALSGIGRGLATEGAAARGAASRGNAANDFSNRAGRSLGHSIGRGVIEYGYQDEPSLNYQQNQDQMRESLQRSQAEFSEGLRRGREQFSEALRNAPRPRFD